MMLSKTENNSYNFQYRKYIQNKFTGSPVLQGRESFEDAGNHIFKEIVEVASGKLTKAEILGHREFSINRLALSL